MDYLDFLFYIVLGVIGIFSSINTSKAKKQATDNRKVQSPARQEAKPAPAEDMAEDDTMPEIESTIPEVSVSLDDIFKALRERRPLEIGRKKTPTVQPQPVITEPKTTPTIEEGISVTRNKDLTKDEISDRGVYEEDNEVALNMENIDWRQAVITSEILNKKY